MPSCLEIVIKILLLMESLVKGFLGEGSTEIEQIDRKDFRSSKEMSCCFSWIPRLTNKIVDWPAESGALSLEMFDKGLRIP